MSQRVNSRTQSKWRIPEDERVFDLNELDEWEDRILWGDAPPNQCVLGLRFDPLSALVG